MNPLPLDTTLISRLTKTLKSCTEFTNAASVRALFVGELEPYKNALVFPERSSIDEYVEGCLELLKRSKLKNGPYLLPIFLDVLIDKYAYDELSNDLQKEKTAIQNLIQKAEQESHASAQYFQDASPQNYLGQLAQLISDCFNDDDIANICADISGALTDHFLYLEYEDLRGQTSQEKGGGALVSYCYRRGLITHLVNVCQQTRTNISWPDPRPFLSVQRTRAAKAEQERLANMIAEYFDDDDFRILCFDLDVEIDLFSDLDRANQARKLIDLFDKRNRWQLVRSICAQDWPSLNWPEQLSTLNLSQESTFVFTPKQKLRRSLRQYLHSHFASDELRELCFYADADRELFANHVTVPKNIYAIQIIEYFENNDSIDHLISECQRARPLALDGLPEITPTQKETPSKNLQLIQLYERLLQSLSSLDLQILITDLKMPLNFSRKGIGLLDLIVFCDQNKKLNQLIVICKKFP